MDRNPCRVLGATAVAPVTNREGGWAQYKVTAIDAFLVLNN